MAASKRGAFILFEGADHCGKTTQCKMLVDWMRFRGLEVKYISFPDRLSSITGAVLNNYLQKGGLEPHVSHLLFSANRWEKAKEMEDWLNAGKHLVVDRYAYSGIAYTVAKQNISMEWASKSDTGLPAPDLVVYLHLDWTELRERPGFGDEIFDTKSLQKGVQAVFETLRLSAPLGVWHVVDAKQLIAIVHLIVQSLVNKTIDRVAELPLSTLRFS